MHLNSHTFLIQWRIFLADPHPPILLVTVFSLDHVHLHGPVQQHDGEDQDTVEDSQDAPYLTNLELKIMNCWMFNGVDVVFSCPFGSEL